MANDRENREHHRFSLSYPIRLFSSRGHEMAASETINVSQTGAFLKIPLHQLPEPGEILNVTISIPEDCYHGEDLGDFTSEASVVRHHPRESDADLAGVAVTFSKPLQFVAEA